MKNYFFILSISVIFSSYSAEGEVSAVTDISLGSRLDSLLNPLLAYQINEPTPDDIMRFLDKYPVGITYQNVFSNTQQGALCGSYALQNLLWYRANIGNNPLLGEQQELFKRLFSNPDTIAELDYVEASPLDRLAEKLIPKHYFLVSSQQQEDGTFQFVVRNPQGLEYGINFVETMHQLFNELQSSIVSVIVNTGGHWIALTIVFNADKHVYLVANSLGGSQTYINSFVKNLIEEIEEGKSVGYATGNFDPGYEIAPNTLSDEAERSGWVQITTYEQFLEQFKKNIEDNFVNNSGMKIIEEFEGDCSVNCTVLNSFVKDYIYHAIILPAILEELKRVRNSVQTESFGDFSSYNVKKYWEQGNLNTKVCQRIENDLPELFRTVFSEYPIILQNNICSLVQPYLNPNFSFIEKIYGKVTPFLGSVSHKLSTFLGGLKFYFK